MVPAVAAPASMARMFGLVPALHCGEGVVRAGRDAGGDDRGAGVAFVRGDEEGSGETLGRAGFGLAGGVPALLATSPAPVCKSFGAG